MSRAERSVLLGRPVLLPKAAVSYRTSEDDDDSHQQGRDSTAQYRADDYVSDDIAGAACLWPEMADHPLAQRQSHDAGTEEAPGPPVTQLPEGPVTAGTPADTALGAGRQGV